MFGGNVTHSGLPISAGVRHLFVVSFTLRPSKREPLPPPQSPEELYAAMLRERESESAGLAADVTSCHVYFIFAWAALMMKFCKNLAGPCPLPLPTYLPTYPTYGKLKKKSLDG